MRVFLWMPTIAPAAVDLVTGPLVGGVCLGLQRGALIGQLPRAYVRAGPVRRGRLLLGRLAALVQVIRPRPALLVGTKNLARCSHRAISDASYPRWMQAFHVARHSRYRLYRIISSVAGVAHVRSKITTQFPLQAQRATRRHASTLPYAHTSTLSTGAQILITVQNSPRTGPCSPGAACGARARGGPGATESPARCRWRPAGAAAAAAAAFGGTCSQRDHW